MTRTYDALYRESVEDPAAFWGREASRLHWFHPWDRVLDEADAPFVRWFPGGRTNLCYNAVDRHVLGGRGNRPAGPVSACSQVPIFFLSFYPESFYLSLDASGVSLRPTLCVA